jgi:hypothetical protein
MLRAYARYFSAMQVIFGDAVLRLRLEKMGNDLILIKGDGSTSDWSKWRNAKFWQGFRTQCEEIDLDSAIAQTDRILEEIKKEAEIEPSKLESLLDELRNRIADQLASRMFLYVPASKISYWENGQLFGEEVFNKISEATTDIYEAGSCFAVGRAGGTVYHCMGIMQAVLFKIGKMLGCTINLDVDHWGTVAQKIKDALDVVRKQAEAKKGDIEAWAEWKRREASYNELLSDLSAVEKAWRHTSAHHRQTHTIDQAEKVLGKVKDFAQHAASLLP